MKFIHLYAAWMFFAVVARLAGLISKNVFEPLVIIGITFAAAEAYKGICEFHYDWHRERAKLS